MKVIKGRKSEIWIFLERKKRVKIDFKVLSLENDVVIDGVRKM